MGNEIKAEPENKQFRKDCIEPIHAIIEISAGTKRKPATIKFAIPDELARQLLKREVAWSKSLCPDGFPKIMSLCLTWVENLSDVEVAKNE